MTSIHKGEQYHLRFQINIGDRTQVYSATPDNIDGLRIKVLNKLKEYPGELEFDTENGIWKYPLTAEQSRAITPGEKEAQVAVKLGDDILKTDVFGIDVKNSIIMEPW